MLAFHPYASSKMNSVIPRGHGPWRAIARSTMMSESSYAVFRDFAFIAGLATLRRYKLAALSYSSS
jgi:hypothetical protein